MTPTPAQLAYLRPASAFATCWKWTPLQEAPMRRPLDKCGYICRRCAQYYGGVWPDGHVATSHTGKCDACGQESFLANVGDWNWPDKARGMRD